MVSETTIDYTPLGHEPSRAEQERVRAEVLRGDFGRESQEDAEGPAGGTVVGAMVGGLLVFVGVVTTAIQMIGGSSSEDVVVGLAFIALGLGIGLAVKVLVDAAGRRDWRRTVQLVAFATANDLDFQPHSEVPKLPGVPRRASHASTSNRMRWTVDGVPAEMATYHRASGGRAYSVECRYLAVHLGVDLPAMTFDCGRRGPVRGEHRAGPDAFEGLPHSLRSARRAPGERQTALFSEPVVALLTDGEHFCNAEYVNGWFLAYYRRGSDVSEGRWRHAFALARAVAETRPALTAGT